MSEIKVKKARVIDNTVAVRNIAEEHVDIIDKMVAELRDVSDYEFKMIVTLAKAFRKADAKLMKALSKNARECEYDDER